MKIYTDTLQTTLAIIKPDGMPCKREYLKKFIKKGFNILDSKTVIFTPEQAAEFYQVYEKAKFFMLLVLSLSKGPCEVLILTKENAVLDFLSFCISLDCPPENRSGCVECLHCLFGEFENDYQRPLHASIGIRNAHRELGFVFPNFIVDDQIERTNLDNSRLFCNCDAYNQFVQGLLTVSEQYTDHPVTGLAKILKSGNPRIPTVSHSEDSLNRAVQTLTFIEAIGAHDMQRIQEENKTNTSSSVSADTNSSVKAPSSCIVCSPRSSSSSSSNINIFSTTSDSASSSYVAIEKPDYCGND